MRLEADGRGGESANSFGRIKGNWLSTLLVDVLRSWWGEPDKLLLPLGGPAGKRNVPGPSPEQFGGEHSGEPSEEPVALRCLTVRAPDQSSPIDRDATRAIAVGVPLVSALLLWICVRHGLLRAGRRDEGRDPSTGESPRGSGLDPRSGAIASGSRGCQPSTEPIQPAEKEYTRG